MQTSLRGYVKTLLNVTDGDDEVLARHGTNAETVAALAQLKTQADLDYLSNPFSPPSQSAKGPGSGYRCPTTS